MPNAVLPLRLGVGSLLCRCCTIVLTTIRLLVEGLIFVPPLLSKNGAGGILYSGLSVCQWVCESVSRGKAETEVFRAQDWDEVEAFMCGAVLRVAAVAWFFPLNYGCHIFVDWVASLSRRHERLKAVFKVVLWNTHL